jgi:hypothetical protein
MKIRITNHILTTLLCFLFAAIPAATAAEPAWQPNNDIIAVTIDQKSRIRYTPATEMIDASFTNKANVVLEIKVVCGDSSVGDRGFTWRMAPGEKTGKPFQVLKGFPLNITVFWRKPSF